MTACVLELPMHLEKVPTWDLGAPKQVALEIEMHLEHVFFSLIQAGGSRRKQKPL